MGRRSARRPGVPGLCPGRGRVPRPDRVTFLKSVRVSLNRFEYVQILEYSRTIRLVRMEFVYVGS